MNVYVHHIANHIYFFVVGLTDDTIQKVRDRGVVLILFKSLQLSIHFRKKKKIIDDI